MATLIYTKEVFFLYASQQITQGKKKNLFTMQNICSLSDTSG